MSLRRIGLDRGDLRLSENLLEGNFPGIKALNVHLDSGKVSQINLGGFSDLQVMKLVSRDFVRLKVDFSALDQVHSINLIGHGVVEISGNLRSLREISSDGIVPLFGRLPSVERLEIFNPTASMKISQLDRLREFVFKFSEKPDPNVVIRLGSFPKLEVLEFPSGHLIFE